MNSGHDADLASSLLTREQILALAQSNPEALADLVLAQQEIIVRLVQKIQTLEQRIIELENRLAKDSHNSSKPPSSDGYKKPQPQSRRKRKGRKSGGQRGHPGSTLKFAEHPDRVVLLPLDECPHCKEQLRKNQALKNLALNDQAAAEYERRQEFEIPAPKYLVTEYRAEIKNCPGCGRRIRASFPAHLKSPVQYGPRFLSFLVYLHHQQLLPVKRIRQLCEDLFGQPVSEEVILQAGTTCCEKLEPFESALIEGLQRSPVLHVDESGLRVGKELHWLHTATTPALTFYGVHKKRGKDAPDQFGILPKFQGTLVHDFWQAYLNYDCHHGLCNAHLLRELIYLQEQEQQAWAGHLLDLLTEMNKFIQSMQGRVTQLSERQKEPWIKRFREIVALGRAANPQSDTPREKSARGRRKQSKSQNMLDRLERYEHYVLAFLHDLAVPFTNNLAEQAIRMIRVQQKISGCFRTEKGAHHFARLRSYISTARKQGRNILHSIEQAMQDNCFLPTMSII